MVVLANEGWSQSKVPKTVHGLSSLASRQSASGCVRGATSLSLPVAPATTNAHRVALMDFVCKLDGPKNEPAVFGAGSPSERRRGAVSTDGRADQAILCYLHGG